MQSAQQPFIVTVVQTPTRQTTLEDVVLGSIGMAGAMLLFAMFLGVVLAVLLLGWNRRHPPESQHLPPVSPLVPDSTAPPSLPSR